MIVKAMEMIVPAIWVLFLRFNSRAIKMGMLLMDRMNKSPHSASRRKRITRKNIPVRMSSDIQNKTVLIVALFASGPVMYGFLESSIEISP
jgi:hypothetical protein